jgi:hypothetical protein
MKKCSTSLATKEMQIKITLRFHLTTLVMAIFKVNNNNKYWQGCSNTRTLIPCWWECKPLWKAAWRFLKKLKIEQPYDPVILLLDIHSKKHKITI